MPPPASPLRLEPFCGVRYAEHLDLSAVTAPPYDVLDDEAVARLTASDEHNVVRLVLPHYPDRSVRDATARATLDQWLADETLVVDPTPALYVYEQRRGDVVLLRGLIGALELHDPSDGVVLPHEDVMPWPVEDRASLQAALEAHVEPIWLLYDGGGAASLVVADTASEPPLADATTADGVRHRLWAISNPDSLETIATDLAGGQALIADGHHRYAAYRQVQRARHDQGRGGGPWDEGLALLVDLRTHAPRVSAIHRVVVGLTIQAISGSLCGGELSKVSDTSGWAASWAALSTGRVLVVDADGAQWLLTLPDEAERGEAFNGTPGAGRSSSWQCLDTAFLHDVLFPAWGVSEDAVSYDHEAAHAVRSAEKTEGVALLMAPVGVTDVLALAAAGERMPRKSTSFGPKPRSGFVLRSIAAD